MLSYRSGWHQQLYSIPWDVVVVGAGITGLHAAIHLKQEQPNWRVLVLEQHSWGASATTQNAGFLCLGSPGELLSDLNQFGEHAVMKTLSLRWRGARRLLSGMGGKKIGWKKTGGYEGFTDSQNQEFALVQNNLKQLNIIMHRITGMENFYSEVSRKEIPLPKNHGFLGGFKMKFEGQIQPALLWENLKLKALNLGVFFQSDVKVEQITTDKKEYLLLNNGPSPLLKTSKIILATNAATGSIVPNVAIVPGRGQVILTKAIAGFPLKATFHAEQGYLYFRNVGDRLLLGGGRHWDFKTENTLEIANNSNITNQLKDYAEKFIVGAPIEIEHQWSGIMGFTPDKQPILTEHAPGWVIAAGLNGMGMAMGAELGRLAAEKLFVKKKSSVKDSV